MVVELDREIVAAFLAGLGAGCSDFGLRHEYGWVGAFSFSLGSSANRRTFFFCKLPDYCCALARWRVTISLVSLLSPDFLNVPIFAMIQFLVLVEPRARSRPRWLLTGGGLEALHALRVLFGKPNGWRAVTQCRTVQTAAKQSH